MKQLDIIKAYKAVQKYEKEQLPLDIGYKLFKLKKLLEDQWEFQLKKETEIFEKYKPEQSEDKLIFKEPKDAEKFSKEMKDLSNLEVDIDVEKVDIDFGDSLKITVQDIEALEPFVNFE